MSYDEDIDGDDRSTSPRSRRRGSSRRGARKEREHVVETLVQETLANCAPTLPGQIFAVMPGNNGLHTDETIREAIWKSGGKLSIAAGWLGVRRRYLEGRITESEELQESIYEIEQMGLDVAETQLDALVYAGADKAVIFKLKTKGKARGWAENKQPANSNTITLDAARELEGRMVSAFVKAREMAVEAFIVQKPAPMIEAEAAQPPAAAEQSEDIIDVGFADD